MFSRFRQTRLSRQHLFHALLRGSGRRSATPRNLIAGHSGTVLLSDQLEARCMLAAAFPGLTWEEPIADGAVIQRTLNREVLNPESAQAVGTTSNLNGNGLEFNFTVLSGTPQFAIDGFQAAADLWSSILTDDIVVNIEIGYIALGAGILGSAGSTTASATLTQVRDSLIADVSSLDDALAVANLPTGSSLSLYTSDPNTGAAVIDNDGSNNNTILDVNTSVLKAVGLRPAGDAGEDASITFSNLFTWDFDRSDGITAGAFDFIGVAAHEIGHALGFRSGVDIVDITRLPNGPSAPTSLNNFRVHSVHDLFRYSTASIANGTDIDARADGDDKFYSLDGGTTQLATFSEGRFNGDGQQASHWKDNLGIGIMDPTAAPGEYADITNLDVLAFDAMGWDVRADFGDAPNAYGTDLASDGARHHTFSASGAITDPEGAATLFLGAAVSSERDGRPSATADLDSDDGVSFAAGLQVGQATTVAVTTSGAGEIALWIDFDNSQTFDNATERFAFTAPAAGTYNIPVAVPGTATVGNTYARVRLATAASDVANPSGPARDGEVEDYAVAINGSGATNSDPVVDDQTFSIAENEPNATVVGTVVATDSDAGQTLTYAITAGNGNAPGVFAIDNNGQLTVNDSTQLDFETTQQYQLTVQVTDDGSPAGSDTATITINVTDVDEINDAPVVNFGLTGAGNRADLYGTVGVAQFGEGVAGVGDVNNDGFDDFLVASTRETGDANASGVARVFSGRDGALLHTLNGPGNSSSFGQAAAGIGDINADGHDDFIIGAPDEQAGQGAARVYSGVDGSVLFTYTGINSSAGLGRSVAAAGDVNNDGVGDFIVGAPDEEVGGVPLHGVVAVYSGVDGTELRRFEGDDFFQYYGTAVAPAGDVNNDGFDDIIVGAGGGGTSTHGSIGFAEIRSGADGSILRTFTGTGAQDRFGDSIANIGDITGDGFDDFAIGEPLGDGNGAIREGLVFVFNGQTGAEIYRFQGTDFASRFGQSVSSAGDFNRDGTADIIVSAAADSTGLGLAGSVWIYSGADGSLLYQEDGEFGDQLGNAIANAGDLNNDGVDEVIFGASGVDTSVISGGKASILYSAPVADDPPANFVEGGGPINVVDNLSIIDEDDLNLTQAVVQITGNYLNTEDVLAISGAAPLGISVSAFNTVTGAITLTGTASIGAYIQTLKLITYNNTAVTSTATRTVTLTVIDENSVNDPVGMLMGADTRDILVFRVNNDPVIDDQAFSIDENSPNATLVGNVVANDPDAGQALTYAITAGNGVAPGAFTIDATGALRVNDSAQIDFETTSTFTLTVQVTDDGFPTLSDTATITVNVRDIDEPPTITLANTTNTLPEDTDTSSRIKVADIIVTDDVSGTSTLSLSGADAALFEISGTELFLIAGAALDFETNPSLDVTVNVDDPALGGSPDNSASLSIAVTDVNEPPTIALLNTVTFLAESTDTSARIKVADVVVTDDAIGANVLGLTGPDAALFELVGLELYLIAGATLDFESNPVLDVTVTVNDAAIGTTPDDSADLAIAITDGNEPPSVSLANVIGPLAENTDTSSRIKVADIVVTDDALGSFTLSLSGTNASFFEIAGTELFLSAGVSLDFETRPVLNVVISVDDATVGATTDDSAVLSLPIADVNEPPAIALVNTVTSLAEDILTTSPVKVANVVIIDDALGTNTLSLTGADAALFQIVGTELFLVAGAVLDFETKPVLNVTVVLDDTAVGATPDGTADLTINITDASDPPTVTLANTVTSLPENTDTTARTRVADIIITDDALGTNTLSLTGADAALFEIVGNQLFIVAGAGIDFETNPALDVTVNVDDATVGASPDDTASLSISVSDVNEAPSVALANEITTLSESTDTSAQIKVADIVITDDALGTNTLSLSGADASLFEIVGTQLFLVAGAALDFETNPVLDVTVNVDDTAIGATPDDTADLVVTVTDIDEPPVVTLTNVTTNLPEDTDTSSRIKVADIVVIDDVGGVSTLSLSGADQELFEIDGLELFLKAGVTLFERTNPVLDVSVSVDDPTIGATPDDTALLSIIVDRVYQDPVVEHGTEGVIVRTGRAARRLMPNASVKDLDSTNLNGGRVTVEIKFSNITDEITFLQRNSWRFRHVGQGMFEISQGQTPVANATISFDSFTSIRTINLQLLEGATPHKTSVVLRSILFRRTDRETAAPRVTVTVEDIQGLTGRTTKRLLQWVSKEPGRYWSPDFTQSYTIGSGPLQVTGEASLVDLDGPDYGGGRITAVLSGPTFEEFDRLSIATGGNLVINGNKVEIGGQAVATVTATDNRRIKMNLLPGATTEHVSTIIEALRYEHTGTLPRFVSKQVNLWVRDPNGLLVQTAANSIPRHQINISNVPATLANSGPAVRYLPGSAPVRTAPAIDVIDDFQTENPIATVRLTNARAGDRLDLIPRNGEPLSIVGGSLVMNGQVVGTVENRVTSISISFTADATRSAILKALRAISFSSSSTTPEGIRNLRYEYQDAQAGTDTLDAQLDVTIPSELLDAAIALS